MNDKVGAHPKKRLSICPSVRSSIQPNVAGLPRHVCSHNKCNRSIVVTAPTASTNWDRGASSTRPPEIALMALDVDERLARRFLARNALAFPLIWIATRSSAYLKNYLYLCACRRSHKLHQRRRHSDARNQHLLLDHLHVHDTWPAASANRNGRGWSGIGQWVRPGEALSQLLSMGAIRAILPGEWRSNNM